MWKRSIGQVLLVAAGSAVALPACVYSDRYGPATGCDDLDLARRDDLSVGAYRNAVLALYDRTVELESKWLTICNAINADLKLDTSAMHATDAARVLAARISASGAKVTIHPNYTCSTETAVGATCEAQCGSVAAGAGCLDSCDGLETATVTCEGEAEIQVEGDPELQAALSSRRQELAGLFGVTDMLLESIARLAGGTGSMLKADAESASANICMESTLRVVLKAQANGSGSRFAGDVVAGKSPHR